MNSRRLRTLVIAITLCAVAAVPVMAARGKADFTRFVVIGDSYGAGVSNGSLNANHQPFSWAAILAKQLGKTLCPSNATATDNCWAQSLVSPPGLPAEIVLTDLVRSGTTITPVLTTSTGSGAPLMSTFARPFNNLSVPGLRIVDADVVRGNEAGAGAAQFILRGQGTQVSLALAQNPTFIAVWMGGNDVLGSALAGTGAAATPIDSFVHAYAGMLDKLIAGAPNAGIVVGTLPNPEDGLRLPVFTALKPVVTDSAGQPVIVNGSTIPLVGVREDGSVGPLSPDTLILLSARADIAQGYGLPKIPPFNLLPRAGEPLPNNRSLTPAEQATLKTRITEYNAAIRAIARDRDIPVADIEGLFNKVVNGQMSVGGFPITGAFITGGFISFDGFHLTDLGYLLFANEYIKAINKGYGTKVPVASISTMFANNGAFFPSTASGQLITQDTFVEFSVEASKALQDLWTPVEQTTTTPAPRRRAGNH